MDFLTQNQDKTTMLYVKKELEKIGDRMWSHFLAMKKDFVCHTSTSICSDLQQSSKTNTASFRIISEIYTRAE